MPSISKFIKTLTQFNSTSTVHNPYQNARIAKNLSTYLTTMLNRHERRLLLIGEAPGYKGCKVTGIPFTSGQVIHQSTHPLWGEIRDQIHLETIETENTATIVWNYLLNTTTTPLFWNAFPFHPHPIGSSHKNRKPSAEELNLGTKFLQQLIAIYQPHHIAGIGHSGIKAIKLALPNVETYYIRHPSFGGKAEFIRHFDNFLLSVGSST